MTTWKRGRELLARRIRAQIIALEDFWELLRVERPARVPGTGVFMTSNAEGAPPALLQNFLLNRVVHQEVILLTIVTTEQPRVLPNERVSVQGMEYGFKRVIGRYGFMEQPDIPALLMEHHVLSSSDRALHVFPGSRNRSAGRRRRDGTVEAAPVRLHDEKFTACVHVLQRAAAPGHGNRLADPFLNCPSKRRPLRSVSCQWLMGTSHRLAISVPCGRTTASCSAVPWSSNPR